MSKHKHHHSRKQRLVIFLATCSIIVICLALLTVIIRHVYDTNLNPVSNNQNPQIVTINSGSSVDSIADLLHQDRLVRSSWAFEWYVRDQGLRSSLQAGTYDFNQSQGVTTIVHTLTTGKIATKLVTILPGKRLDQISATLINDGFSPASVTAALQPSLYRGVPIVSFKPSGNSLEGLLYPDSFDKTATTNPSTIIRESLVEMGQMITPSIEAGFAHEGLDVYQGITLASIVQQEVAKPSDQAQVAQVFIKRLSSNMPLDSDVTAIYGAIEAGQAPSITYASPYNTLLNSGLPPGPIATISQSALQAVADPASTGWLYFVSGDNGTTYFSQTLAQQQANITQYCHTLCSPNGQ